MVLLWLVTATMTDNIRGSHNVVVPIEVTVMVSHILVGIPLIISMGFSTPPQSIKVFFVNVALTKQLLVTG